MGPTFRSLFFRLGMPAVLLLASGAPYAQAPAPPQTPSPQSSQPQPPAEQRPTFRTEANYVRVDAYPTKDGQPVTDLSAADFELSEDGKLQKIETVEHVVVRPAGAQSERVEPGSTREMLQAANNPRTRVFVIFLDEAHVMVDSSHNIAGPIIRLIDRVLGPDDLVGLMMPGMSPSEVTLARRTEITEQQLREHWTWGRRGRIELDELEESYRTCFGANGVGTATARIAEQMIDRKRERQTLEALQDLVRYLNAIREGRKAVVTITEGWLLFKPDQSMLGLPNSTPDRPAPVPTTSPVTVGPDGKLTARDPRYIDNSACEADRQRLANIDDEDFLRQIVNEANRGNTTFYPVDPRGLAVFDTPIQAAVPITVDRAMLRTRQEAMHELALGTDGIAVMGSNDLDKGMKRISDDLSSYYLLGYYSSNPATDGGYRSLKLRVKRPGIEVRYRRGYRAASASEVAAARKAADAPAVDVKAPLDAALGALARMRPEARLQVQAMAVPTTGTVWIAGELPIQPGGSDEWAQGGTADVQVVRGDATSTARVTLRAGERTFLTSVKAPAGAGDFDVQTRVSSTGGAPANVTVRIANEVRPLLFRRGPGTAGRQVPAADLRFSRADRVHLELPIDAAAKVGQGRLLDRNGNALAIPVAVAERTDASGGQRWLTADVTLAPLAPGDYAIEVSTLSGAAESRAVMGIRLTR